jgi:hypothetical protein
MAHLSDAVAAQPCLTPTVPTTACPSDISIEDGSDISR